MACPGYSDAPDGSRFASITEREIAVRTTVASWAAAQAYKRSIHQSVSRRARHRETKRLCSGGGMSVPVCGMHSSSGAEPRRTVSHGLPVSVLIFVPLLSGLRAGAQSSIM